MISFRYLGSLDIFILDQWGVMHDGKKGFIKSNHLVQTLYDSGKTLIIVSNSSKKINDTKSNLPKLGYDLKYFSEVMTSGEMILQSLLNTQYPETNNLGKNCYHIFDNSKDDHNEFRKDLSKFNFVDNLENR